MTKGRIGKCKKCHQEIKGCEIAYRVFGGNNKYHSGCINLKIWEDKDLIRIN